MRNWQVIPLGKLLLDIHTGKSLSCEERPAELHEWGVLKVSAVSWGAFNPLANKVLPLDFPQPERYEVCSGDILISRANTTELVGASVLVGETRPNLMLSDKTLRLVPDESLILKPYLQISLQLPKARQFIEAQATGTSPSMKNISQDIIRHIPILYPPLQEQRRIAATLREQTAEVECLQQFLKSQLNGINKLPAALLRRAFNGELGNV